MPRSLWRGVRREVGDRDARTDDGRLVADGVDAAQQVDPLAGVADVEPVDPRRRLHRTVGLGEHQVDRDDLVAGPGQRTRDRGADEAGRAGEQHPHRR